MQSDKYLLGHRIAKQQALYLDGRLPVLPAARRFGSVRFGSGSNFVAATACARFRRGGGWIAGVGGGVDILRV